MGRNGRVGQATFSVSGASAQRIQTAGPRLAPRTMEPMVGTTSSPDASRQALRACRLFADLDEVSRGLCAAALRPRRVRKGETIFHAGDPGDSLFLVTQGAVKITIPPDDGSEP